MCVKNKDAEEEAQTEGESRELECHDDFEWYLEDKIGRDLTFDEKLKVKDFFQEKGEKIEYGVFKINVNSKEVKDLIKKFKED